MLTKQSDKGCWGCGEAWSALALEVFEAGLSAYYCVSCDVYTERLPMHDVPTTEEKIQAVLKQCPLLTKHGVDVYFEHKRDKTVRKQKFAEGQEELLKDTETFERLAEFLDQITPTKNINKRTGSYGLKHVAEDWLGHYVANGTFIAASIHHGFRYKRCDDDSPNVMFNMANQDLQRLERECHERHNMRRTHAPTDDVLTVEPVTNVLDWGPITLGRPPIPGDTWYEFPPSNDGVMLCPVCSFQCTHLTSCTVDQLGKVTTVRKGRTLMYTIPARKGFRGSRIDIEGYCENGHCFLLSLQCHKGSIYVTETRLPDCPPDLQGGLVAPEELLHG